VSDLIEHAILRVLGYFTLHDLIQKNDVLHYGSYIRTNFKMGNAVFIIDMMITHIISLHH
jgi:hypothetical protein